MAQFSIKLIGNDECRIPFGGSLFSYFEDFVLNEILTPKSIITRSIWEYWIVFSIYKSNEKSLCVSKLLSITDQNEKIKYVIVSVPFSMLTHSQNMQLAMANILIEGITLFLNNNYKKTTKSFLDAIFAKIDFNYIASIPFPSNRKPYISYIDSSDGLF